MRHYCTQLRDGHCDACESIGERVADLGAERDVERESWPDAALHHYEPTFGRMLTRGGY